ncbi:hypothetical protein QJQ45_017497 [Haematococcus lacustris]|nr:hypothetical protein QJQ45_017497 [Haematococcus lacustris]
MATAEPCAIEVDDASRIVECERHLGSNGANVNSSEYLARSRAEAQAWEGARPAANTVPLCRCSLHTELCEAQAVAVAEAVAETVAVAVAGGSSTTVASLVVTRKSGSGKLTKAGLRAAAQRGGSRAAATASIPQPAAPCVPGLSPDTLTPAAAAGAGAAPATVAASPTLASCVLPQRAAVCEAAGPAAAGGTAAAAGTAAGPAAGGEAETLSTPRAVKSLNAHSPTPRAVKAGKQGKQGTRAAAAATSPKPRSPPGSTGRVTRAGAAARTAISPAHAPILTPTPTPTPDPDPTPAPAASAPVQALTSQATPKQAHRPPAALGSHTLSTTPGPGPGSGTTAAALTAANTPPQTPALPQATPRASSSALKAKKLALGAASTPAAAGTGASNATAPAAAAAGTSTATAAAAAGAMAANMPAAAAAADTTATSTPSTAGTATAATAANALTPDEPASAPEPALQPTPTPTPTPTPAACQENGLLLSNNHATTAANGAAAGAAGGAAGRPAQGGGASKAGAPQAAARPRTAPAKGARAATAAVALPATLPAPARPPAGRSRRGMGMKAGPEWTRRICARADKMAAVEAGGSASLAAERPPSVEAVVPLGPQSGGSGTGRGGVHANGNGAAPAAGGGEVGGRMEEGEKEEGEVGEEEGEGMGEEEVEEEEEEEGGEVGEGEEGGEEMEEMEEEEEEGEQQEEGKGEGEAVGDEKEVPAPSKDKRPHPALLTTADLHIAPSGPAQAAATKVQNACNAAVPGGLAVDCKEGKKGMAGAAAGVTPAGGGGGGRCGGVTGQGSPQGSGQPNGGGGQEVRNFKVTLKDLQPPRPGACQATHTHTRTVALPDAAPQYLLGGGMRRLVGKGPPVTQPLPLFRNCSSVVGPHCLGDTRQAAVMIGDNGSVQLGKLQRARFDPTYPASGGLWPALWGPRPPPGAEPPQGLAVTGAGLRTLEQRWLDSATLLAAQRAAGEREQQGRDVEELLPEEVQGSQTPRWRATNARPPPRPTPEHRAVQRAQRQLDAQIRPGRGGRHSGNRQAGALPAAGHGALDGMVDELARSAQAGQPCLEVWQELLDPTLRREHVIVAWRVLHGSLMVGAMWGHILKEAAAPASSVCRLCQLGPLETLTHAFLTCPSVAPAWEWVLDVYERLTGTRPPSSDALLLLSGRPTHSEDGPFHPPDAHLWLRLRVAYLGSVWRIRCLGPAAALQTQSLAHRVAQGVIFTLSSAVQRDWYRVGRDIRVGLGGAVPSTWFKGRDPRLDERKFASLWPAVSGGWFQRQQGELVVRLSLQWPVPAPPILGAAAEPG